MAWIVRADTPERSANSFCVQPSACLAARMRFIAVCPMESEKYSLRDLAFAWVWFYHYFLYFANFNKRLFILVTYDFFLELTPGGDRHFRAI